jgi:hypothetical protein
VLKLGLLLLCLRLAGSNPHASTLKNVVAPREIPGLYLQRPDTSMLHIPACLAIIVFAGLVTLESYIVVR